MQKSETERFFTELKKNFAGNQILVSLVGDMNIEEYADNKLVFGVGSSGGRSFLNKHTDTIRATFSSLFGKNVDVEIRVRQKEASSDGPLLQFEPSREDVYRTAGLNIHHTFQSFAVSPTNQVAFAAAQAVAKSPGTAYNPLFFYGGVGVGKTHLAQAIARTVLEQKHDAGVLFCSSERFTNELIESIRAKTTPRFRKKYRSLHIIIVDDVQFLAGKQTVQEEFFHTFNTIVSSGGQVILTSDRPPFEIKNLEDRLRSRFSGGLIVDIQQPDFELRTAILLIKAREKNISLSMDAAKMIAEVVHDTRSLEGTLLSLYAKTLGTGRETIDDTLVDAFFSAQTQNVQVRISPQDVIRAVCTYYGIKVSHIKAETRKSHIAKARQIVMYLLRTELSLNLEEVAFVVKRKDHTTVMHAVQKIREQSMKDLAFQKELDAIVASFKTAS